jgi:hypothetical protein
MTAMHLTVKKRQSVRILIGLGAAGCSFAAAATLSATAAPTAHADAWSDIVSAVSTDFVDGTAAYTNFLGAAAGDDVSLALAALFEGVDDDTLAAPDNLFIGSVEALTNESITGAVPFNFAVPTDFTEALTVAQDSISFGELLLNGVSTALTSGDYGTAAYDLSVGLNSLTIDPLQELLLGAAVSF